LILNTYEKQVHLAVESAKEEIDKLLEMMKEGDFDECCICMESGKELVVTNVSPLNVIQISKHRY